MRQPESAPGNNLMNGALSSYGEEDDDEDENESDEEAKS
jgi:hypothetical protein